MRAPLRTRVALAALTLAIAGCDLGGPSGPATISGTVTGRADLGAAVIDLSWDGVQGFDGRGTTLVYSAAVGGTVNRHRAVLVSPVGGDLQFTITLEDERLYAPVVTVVSAVDTGNAALPIGDLRVVLAR